MLTNYLVADHQIKETTAKKANWISIVNPTDTEIKELMKKYDLPEDIFVGDNFSEDVSRIESLQSNALGKCLSLILIDVKVASNPYQGIEDALSPISFIIAENYLLTIGRNDDQLIRKSFCFKGTELDRTNSLVQGIMTIYTHYIQELKLQKSGIDEVSQATRESTKKDYLLKLTDLERNLVYLQQTLDDQKETLDLLWQEQMMEAVAPSSKYDVQVICRRADKQVHLYRELVDSTSGLISALMDNSLNHLMKYLDSAALIISIPTLIFSLWGINTGGLIGKDSTLGSVGVVVLAVVATAIGVFYLRKKDFTD